MVSFTAETVQAYLPHHFLFYEQTLPAGLGRQAAASSCRSASSPRPCSGEPTMALAPHQGPGLDQAPARPPREGRRPRACPGPLHRTGRPRAAPLSFPAGEARASLGSACARGTAPGGGGEGAALPSAGSHRSLLSRRGRARFSRPVLLPAPTNSPQSLLSAPAAAPLTSTPRHSTL